MRIGFTGTGGTGKTTTLNELNNLGLNLPVLRSPTRKVFERWNLLEGGEAAQEAMTPEKRLELQMDIFTERLKEESLEKYENGYISDRTMIDHFSYCLHRCYLSMDDSMLEDVEAVVRDNLTNYDAIFYFPIFFVPESDGMRQQGEAYRSIIDALIYSNGRRLAKKMIEVPNGDPEFRAEWVFDHIKSIR